MTNVQKLALRSKSERIFIETLIMFKKQQGVYTRLYRMINHLSEEGLEWISNLIKEENFNEILDVIIYCEGHKVIA